ncbi:MAG: aldo/keto reductase [Actinomycetota bacterium]
MKFKKLGKTDISVSVIGAGTWGIGGTWWSGTDVKESVETIQTSIEQGINFIDTAPAYGYGVSEEIIGKAIEGQRDKVVLATKCGLVWNTTEGFFHFEHNGVKLHRYLGEESIRKELEGSLKLLKTDYIDLYITHWQDPTTPVEVTMGVLMNLKKEGKIRAIGVSNASLDDMNEYARHGQLDANQEKFNLLENSADKQYIPWCVENNATFLAYSAIAQGLLTGAIDPEAKYNSDDIRSMNALYGRETVIKINAMLKNHFTPMAQKYNCSLTQLAIASVASMQNVIALCGARNSREAIENAKAGDIVISDDDLSKLKNTVQENLGF